MGRSTAIGLSLGIGALLTHGMVLSAVNFVEPLAVSTYQGFFRQILLASEHLWSYANGWRAMSHVEAFGRF